ncbi:sin3 histone deacetylase corepressor complex component sds3 [Anaeramoeba flamelloides]|uniref:Sin3 histone deacetylase corepressor complex component sds3 n=1 Tax=Anaeramoeba flamelloides TaxID=1746091 RepID=A0ABQ8Z801_9EUKA|nr:sin3 histone deacetylase corepressor complex component sds3 [Anaeramoeba flamelloides]
MSETFQTTSKTDPNNEPKQKETTNNFEETEIETKTKTKTYSETKMEKELSQVLKRQRTLYENSVSISQDVRELAQKVNSVEYFNLISLKRQLHKGTHKKFKKQAKELGKAKDYRFRDSEEWYQFQLFNLEKLVEKETIKINNHFEKASRQLTQELIEKIKEGKGMLSRGVSPQNSFYIFEKTNEKRNKKNCSNLTEIEAKVNKVMVGLKEQDIQKDLQTIQNHFSEHTKNQKEDKTREKNHRIVVEIQGKHLIYDKINFFNGSGVYLKAEREDSLFGIITNITKDNIIIKHPDGKESEILLSQLRKNKYQLSTVSSLL